MILNVPEWHLGYEEILDSCRAGEDGTAKTALLLCNADVDAMASARILSYMLRSDGINYQLLPCTTYSALEKTLQETQLEDVRAVVLLNFGASKNLTRLFDVFLHDLVKVYVLDCRRPVHLANVHADANVVIFWDNTQENEWPSDGDNLSGNESSSSSDDDNSSDDDSSSSSDDDTDEEDEEEASFDDVVDATEVRRRDDEAAAEGTTNQALQDDQSPDYDGEDEGGAEDGIFGVGGREDKDEGARTTRQRPDDDEGGDGDGTSKRRRTDNESSIDGETDAEHTGEEDNATAKSTTKEISPRESHRQRRDRLRAYYSAGSFYGSPASYVAYTLASQLRFGEQGDLLWLACVGVTDAYLHARLDVTGYATLALNLKIDSTKLFPSDEVKRVNDMVFAEDLIKGSSDSNQTKTMITFSDRGKIIAGTDYRFFLLRHLSLFDSMIHSDFVSTRMQVWTKRGMQRLQELFATMGYPLEECKQPFAFMKPMLRRRLHEKINENAEAFGLDNFEFTSFFRVTGYQSLLSASDVSYAVTALLECDTPATAATTIDERIDESKQAIESFNIAYDSLNANAAPSVSLNGLANEGHDTSSLVNGGSLSGSTGIGAGIRMAMGLQRSIIATAVGLVDRNAITRLRHFRYAFLTCTSAGENQTSRSDIVQRKPTKDRITHTFSKPLALTRLAHYLMDMHRENGKWTGNKARPLVLMAEKPQTGSYLVVGYEYPEQVGTFVKNKFGMNFELTAKSMNGTFKFDSFDSNVVEVDGNDVQRFIEQLHYLMDSI